MESYNPKYLVYLLDSPGESHKADYKSAVEFKEDTEFSVKLVKHILGFANNDGGYIVIGFNDADLTTDPQLTDAVINSYDTTRLAQHVNSYVSNQEGVSLIVHKQPKDSRIFPIIYIQPFKTYPYFTSDKTDRKGYGAILKKDRIYFRDENARTVELANESHMKQIIDRCVRNRQKEILSEFKDLIEKATGKTLSESVEVKEESPDKWITESRQRAREAESKNES